jgi:5S rRNA maturation endonuclease (ribonuclease M5)
MNNNTFSLVVKRDGRGNLTAYVSRSEVARTELNRILSGLSEEKARAKCAELNADFVAKGLLWSAYEYGSETKSPIPKTWKNGDIMTGNTDYTAISDKLYVKTDIETAFAVIEQLRQSAVPFSSFMKTQGSTATITVNAVHIALAEQFAAQANPSFEPKYVKEKPAFGDILNKFDGVKQVSHGQYAANCPCCSDKKQHLYISEDPNNGNVLLDCKKGCSPSDIVSAAGLKMSDLFTRQSVFIPPQDYSPRTYEPRPDEHTAVSEQREQTADNPDEQHKIVSWRKYNYTDVAGGQKLQKNIGVLDNGEKIAVWKRHENGEYVKGLNGFTPTIYHAENLTKSDKIYIVEGEKDVSTMEKLGTFAVCSPHGSNWNAEYAHLFTDKTVIVITDNDPPGRKYGRNIAENLAGIAKTLTIIPAEKMLPGLKIKGDISDITELVGGEKAKQLIQNEEQGAVLRTANITAVVCTKPENTDIIEKNNIEKEVEERV